MMDDNKKLLLIYGGLFPSLYLLAISSTVVLQMLFGLTFLFSVALSIFGK